MHKHPTREHILFSKIWRNMLDRCENPRAHAYKNYGGRGITVSAGWHDYQQFFSDMWPRPSRAHSLDRRDNNKGYSKENCHWATSQEQVANRRPYREGATPKIDMEQYPDVEQTQLLKYLSRKTTSKFVISNRDQ